MADETKEFLERGGKTFTGELPDDILDVTALGGGIVLGKESKVVFDKAFANKHLGLSEVKGDRPLKNRHVEVLMTAMMRGSFFYEWVNLIVAYCEENQTYYRVNGQHCCWALELLEESDLKAIVKAHGGVLKVQLREYTCKTYEDVRTLYGSVDRNSVRSKRDVMNAQLFGVEGYTGLSRKAINTLTTGFAFWKWDEEKERRKHDADDVSYLLKAEYCLLGTRVADLFRGSREFNKHVFLRPAAVVAAMFSTLDKVPTKAMEFWSSVRDGVGIPLTQDPRLKIRNHLMSIKRTMGKSPERFANDLFSGCINAWNAWRRNEPELLVIRGMHEGKRPSPK